jgi:hypothetical protein
LRATDLTMARLFAEATFFSDHRADLHARFAIATSIIARAVDRQTNAEHTALIPSAVP